MKKLTQRDHINLALYQGKEIDADELSKRMGRTKCAVQALASKLGYTHKAQWPPEKVETLLWLNETQAPHNQIAVVMEWWGWGKITPRQVSGKIARLKKQGVNIDGRPYTKTIKK